jgi:hypothetical protein
LVAPLPSAATITANFSVSIPTGHPFCRPWRREADLETTSKIDVPGFERTPFH